MFTVTDLAKVIDGVCTTVVWDRDWTQDRLVEAELAFYAQDDDGNVWHLGQYPAEYEDDKFVGAPAWFAGLDGAKAGLAMRVESRGDLPLLPGARAEGRVRRPRQGSQDTPGVLRCLRLLQGRPGDPGVGRADPAARELKYYARGVGNVRVGWLGRDAEREVLSLVNLTQLSPQALAAASVEALRLERFAYRASKGL